MSPSPNKATFIVRFWTEVEPATEADWRGKAERVGTDRQCRFTAFEELNAWMRRELSTRNQTTQPPDFPLSQD